MNDQQLGWLIEAIEKLLKEQEETNRLLRAIYEGKMIRV